MLRTVDRPWVRFVGPTVCALLACVLFDRSVVAQTKPAPKTAPKSEDRTLRTRDNQQIQITYYRSSLGKEAPVVVLLHGKGGNRQVWNNLAGRLQQEGFAAITVDLRGHGQSSGGPGATGGSQPTRNLTPRDYQAMVAFDLDAVKEFIFAEHQNEKLNMTKLAIVAADMSVPIAIAFTEVDWRKEPYDDAPTLAMRTPRGQDVRALVLLSPETFVPGVNATRSVNFLKNPAMGIAFLLAVGEKDEQDKGQAKKMFTPLMNTPNSEGRIYLETYPTSLRGTDLIGRNLRTEQHILGFLDKHVKQLSKEWRDRRSQYDRS